MAISKTIFERQDFQFFEVSLVENPPDSYATINWDNCEPKPLPSIMIIKN